MWWSLGWVLSWAVPTAFVSALILLVLLGTFAELRAWRGGALVGYFAALLLAAVFAHAGFVMASFLFGPFERSEKMEFLRRVKLGGGYGYWRALMRKYAR
jgi:hypothetical protein